MGMRVIGDLAFFLHVLTCRKLLIVNFKIAFRPNSDCGHAMEFATKNCEHAPKQAA